MPVSACLDFQAAVRYSAQQFNAKGQAMTIDTLAAAKALERAGMENGHAEAVAVVVRDATADLATKADLNALEDRLNERLAAHESKLDDRLAAHESKLNERFAAFESRLEAKLANSVNRMLLGNMAVAGLLFAALKLFN